MVKKLQEHTDLFQHTAARRRLGYLLTHQHQVLLFQHTAARRRLDARINKAIRTTTGFNTQPPEGGWASVKLGRAETTRVSTHSRPKAAGI